MFQYYYIVLIAEIFCLYHAYKNKADQKWFWIIIIFPLIGCSVYLYHHFYTKDNITTVTEGLQGAINPNYNTKKLEKLLAHCDSVTNKINLATEYLRIGRHQDAIEILEQCQTKTSDKGVDIALVKAYYVKGEFNKAAKIGMNLKENKTFSKSEEKICYAWSLFETGQINLANTTFQDMDDKYCNYPQRIEYCRFLIKTEQHSLAETKLNRLNQEWSDMDRTHKRLYSGLDSELRSLYKQLTLN
jgi:hypothetical protein